MWKDNQPLLFFLPNHQIEAVGQQQDMVKRRDTDQSWDKLESKPGNSSVQEISSTSTKDGQQSS